MNVLVNKQTASEQLETLTKKTIEYLKSVDGTYEIPDYQVLDTPNGKATRVLYKISRNGIPLKGSLTLLKKESNLHMITVSATAANWVTSRAETGRVLNSFTLF